MNNKSRPSCFVVFVALAILTTNQYATAKQDHDTAPIELSGFSMSEAYDIPDDVPLDLDAPILKQLLYRIKRTSPKSRRQYSRYSENVSWQDITSKTEDHRLWVFDRPARLKLIEKHRFKNHTPDEEIKGVYVCYCEAETDNNERGQTFLALARTIPKALPVGVAINEPIRVAGFLFARVSGTTTNDNNEMPVFITDRVAWHPSKATGGVSEAHASLSKHGVDIGLLDLVRENNTRPLESRDAEAFFQMLAAVNKMPEHQIEAEATAKKSNTSPPLGFNELMQNANANFGEAARVTGTVRTCSVISVPHADIQNRLGLSKYYQLMLFPDLDGAKIVVKNKDGTKLDYRRFPITICCTELPEGMTPQSVERKQFVVDGYFFRFWKYQAEKTDQVASAGQVSPLIIAKRPSLINLNENQLDLFLLYFVIAIIVGIIVLIAGYRIIDRRRQTPGEKILSTLPERMDLTGLED